MISAFFINRPKFAFVISIIVTLMGLLAIPSLPVSEFPELAPPQVNVTTSYPGASAEIVKDVVAQVIESEVNGVENMIYMSSKSANDGSYNLSVTFDVGTDADMAQVNVSNRVQQAMAKLPDEVKRQGVNVKKVSPSILMAINLYSPDDKYDNLFLNNYMGINLKNNLARVPGVSEASVIGGMDYSMRLWLDPNKMTALSVTVTDVMQAIKEQNIQVAAGRIGAAPVASDQRFQYTLQTQGRLKTPEEFGNIVLRAENDGRRVLLSDVSRIELGALAYDAQAYLNGHDSALLFINQAADANALEVANGVRAELERLSKNFPEGLKYDVLYDTTDFVEASIDEMYETLLIAIVLVILVVFLFLQDARQTLIPAIAIPVSLIGTFLFLLLFDMSLNTVSLFALILAIGIVVDDAIVVVENVTRHMEDGMAPKEATIKTMKEVTGPVLATTLVLLAVFAPTAVMPGITGKMYAQFSVTICISVLISSVNALTLSPALCATLLRTPKVHTRGYKAHFNRYFDKLTANYTGLVKILLRRSLFVALAFVAMLAATGGIVSKVPAGFVPQEDKKAFFVDIKLPDGSSINRTNEKVQEMFKKTADVEGVSDVISVAGYSIISQTVSSNAGLMIVVLDPWEARQSPELEEKAIVNRINRLLNSQFPGAQVMAFSLPALPGVGTVGGAEFNLQDTAGRSPQELAQVMGGFITNLNSQPEIAMAFSGYRANVPQMFVDVDRVKAKTQGIPLNEIFASLQTMLGGSYVNDFNRYGKVFRVMLQAETQYRNSEDDIISFHVRNNEGEMVPLSTLVKINPVLGPEYISQFNLYSSAQMNAFPAPGHSTGDVIKAIQRASSQLPDGYTYSWSGQTFQEIKAGNLAPIIFALAILFTYLFLVAQYESWSIPVAVLLSVPVAIFGALLAVVITGSEMNLYTQIGMVLLIGMACKSAILVVEFACHLHAEGASVFEAAVTAAKLRFRAVLMTSIAFILGTLPLVIATGAGAESRHSLGYAIFGGMIAASVIGTILVPVLYYLIQNARDKTKGNKVSTS
ncbi:HAE1 family hydrophobic/amphiphilic exporter-1 [Sinobacterium caligoides]|uniref:Efflux pump membrane transporter n=1 Tax=Sinobacterium caligoides TaxID=933926 RepID=A0A3N2DPV2_9GAMM|nr:multidrug efflux RND transporter permease subunit [Sinobacterium caligoides]ROS01817.1 HAE1 family hydrophobic/amphiphilic exporter-1 [Sinobacterium caligoides]